ncbi:MAG: hypothetical protein ACKV2T_34160 [Kofleriaceae bacterium]
MATASATQASVSDEQARTAQRSPGLTQYRKSPFRLLRLPVNATAKQAVWQCDKALARARVGMSLPDPDPVPWLAAGDEVELQEASQTMEAPLSRLVEQLLWFDFVEDADGKLLEAALTNADAAQLRQYLNLNRDGTEHASPTAHAANPYRDAAAAPPTTMMAHELNQANIRLLLGFSAVRSAGPNLYAASTATQRAALAWKDNAGIVSVDDPHRAIKNQGILLSTADAWATLLGEAVMRWGALLGTDLFAEHVKAKIATLGDELLSTDDLEAVLSAIRTRIADLVVGETKLEMAQGRIGNVGHLAGLAGKSQAEGSFDAETWLVAFRPLKTQFQSELADLAPDAETGNGLVEDVNAYLDRLSTLAARWRPLDEGQLLGLSALVDDAVGEAFAKLRSIQREKQLEPRFKEVLGRIGQIAVSSSIKERVKGYFDRLADVQKAMCHFCGKRELEASSCASVSSQMETGREYYGNTTRIHYQVGARPVARCPRCAQVHGYIRNVGTIAFFALASSVIFFALLKPATWFQNTTTGVGVVLVCIGIAAAWGLGFIAREIAANAVTAKGERKFGEYASSSAVEGLRADGFVSMKYDFRPDAWERVNKHGVKAAGGGEGIEVLKTLGWIGLVIVLIALKVGAAGGC